MTRRWRLVRWVLVLVVASCSGGEESGGGPSTTPAPSPPSTPAPSPPSTPAPSLPSTPAPPTPAPPPPPAPSTPAPPPPPAPTAAPTPTPPTASPTPSPEAGDDDEETTAAALPVAPPSAESPTGAYFGAADSPLSREIYLERVADQVDLRFHHRRAEEVRFWMQSGIIQLRGAAPRGLGDPVAGSPGRPVARGRIGTVVDRHAWTVPLGTTTLGRRRALALGTTRCLVDYRYPISGVDIEWRNFALFSDVGRNHEVFRLAGIAELFGVNATFDPRADRTVVLSQRYLEGRQGERYFDHFLSGAMPPAGAQLPVGQWRDGTGADFVVLQIPLEDPGIAAIAPARHLGVSRQLAVLRETLEARGALWPGRFDFLPRSGRCATDGEYASGSADWEAGRGEVYAATSGLSSVLALLGRPLGEVGSVVARRIVERGRRARGPVWRTAVHPLRAGAVRDVAWSADGHVTLSVELTRGRPTNVVLAGIVREGLDEAAATRVLESIRGVAASQGAVVAIVRTDARGAAGSLTVPGAQLDVAAELLRRGRVRLDTADEPLLAQEPGLVLAAERATNDAATRANPAIADEGYGRRVAAAAASIAAR